MNIEKFTRIGFRLIYIHNFINRELASNALIDANIISLPKGKHFNIEGKIFLPKYGFNWEGESISVKILVEARDRKIDMDINPNFDDINPVHLLKHELVYDIDYSTLGVVSRGQLDIREWINQSYHIIRRDSKKILGGI